MEPTRKRSRHASQGTKPHKQAQESRQNHTDLMKAAYKGDLERVNDLVLNDARAHHHVRLVSRESRRRPSANTGDIDYFVRCCQAVHLCLGQRVP